MSYQLIYVLAPIALLILGLAMLGRLSSLRLPVASVTATRKVVKSNEPANGQHSQTPDAPVITNVRWFIAD